MTYDLFDSSGALVHRGTSPSSAGATVQNNNPNPSGVFDVVTLYCFVNNVSGLITPAPLYSPAGEVGAVTSFLGFSGPVSPESDYLPDLSIPTAADAFLAFPSKRFSASMYFGDGDFFDFIDPYQYIETRVEYSITSVSISQIPTPSAAAVLTLGGLVASRRRRVAR